MVEAEFEPSPGASNHSPRGLLQHPQIHPFFPDTDRQSLPHHVPYTTMMMPMTWRRKLRPEEWKYFAQGLTPKASVLDNGPCWRELGHLKILGIKAKVIVVGERITPWV